MDCDQENYRAKAEAEMNWPKQREKALTRSGRRLLLAHEIDVPPALVSDWFAGRRTPTLEEGLRLKAFLDQRRETAK